MMSKSENCTKHTRLMCTECYDALAEERDELKASLSKILEVMSHVGCHCRPVKLETCIPCQVRELAKAPSVNKPENGETK